MNIKIELSLGMTGVTANDINMKELRQMHELKTRIEDVLKSHAPESKEKKYISDDDLKLMRAILHVFTKEYYATQASAFDDALKELEKPVEEDKPQPKIPIGDDQFFG